MRETVSEKQTGESRVDWKYLEMRKRVLELHTGKSMVEWTCVE